MKSLGFERLAPDALRSAGNVAPRILAGMEDIAHLKGPIHVLEVGSWLGASAVGWLQACQLYGAESLVVCLDTWLGSREHRELDDPASPWGRQQLQLNQDGFPCLFNGFSSTVRDHGCTDRIVPMPIDADNGYSLLTRLQIAFDVIYIDGPHDTDTVYRQITGARQLCAPGAFICGTPTDWPTVRDAAVLAAAVLDMTMLEKAPMWLLADSAHEHALTALRSLGWIDAWNPEPRPAATRNT